MRASGAAAARSSIDVVAIVDRPIGMPLRCATRPTAASPSWFIIRVKPVGAKANGSADVLPRISRVVSTSDTPRSTFGWNSIRR